MKAIDIKNLLAGASTPAFLLIAFDTEHVLRSFLPTTHEIDLFFVSSVFSALICFFFITIRSLFSNRSLFRYSRLSGLFAASSFLLIFYSANNSINEFVTSGCGVILGVALALSFMRFIESLSFTTEREGITFLSALVITAALIAFISYFLHDSSVVMFTALILFLPSLLSFNKQKIDQPNQPSNQNSFTEKTKVLFSRNWTTYCGLLLCITIGAGIWSDSLIVRPQDSLFIQPQAYSLHIGLSFSGLALYVSSKKMNSDAISLLHLIAPLICIGSLIIFKFFAFEGDMHRITTLFTFGFSLSACTILHIARLSADANKGVPKLFAFGLSLTIVCGLFIIWHMIWPFLGFHLASAFDLAVKVLYLVVIAVQTIVLAQRHPLPKPGSNEAFDEICNSLAMQFGLTKREQEVFFYLCQGRSSSYIAAEQFVSINTIKTHIRRIYTKANVHSKQELLELIHENDIQKEERPIS